VHDDACARFSPGLLRKIRLCPPGKRVSGAYHSTLYNGKAIDDFRLTIFDIRLTIYDLRLTIYDLRFTIDDLRFGIWDLGFGIWRKLRDDCCGEGLLGGNAAIYEWGKKKPGADTGKNQ